jgi:hypothetical protein
VVDLAHFTQLKCFSWRGITRGSHFWSLGEFIKNRAGVEGLRTRTIDLVNWWQAQKSWSNHQVATLGGFPPRPDYFFARRVLCPHRDEEAPVLSNLSLSAASLEFAEPDMIKAFNMNNLRTLRTLKL